MHIFYTSRNHQESRVFRPVESWRICAQFRTVTEKYNYLSECSEGYSNPRWRWVVKFYKFFSEMQASMIIVVQLCNNRAWIILCLLSLPTDVLPSKMFFQLFVSYRSSAAVMEALVQLISGENSVRYPSVLGLCCFRTLWKPHLQHQTTLPIILLSMKHLSVHFLILSLPSFSQSFLISFIHFLLSAYLYF